MHVFKILNTFFWVKCSVCSCEIYDLNNLCTIYCASFSILPQFFLLHIVFECLVSAIE